MNLSCRCVPRYWTNNDLGKLREAKKVELNDWNKEVLALITDGMPDVFSKGRTQDGLTCIIIDKVVNQWKSNKLGGVGMVQW